MRLPRSRVAGRAVFSLDAALVIGVVSRPAAVVVAATCSPASGTGKASRRSPAPPLKHPRNLCFVSIGRDDRGARRSGDLQAEKGRGGEKPLEISRRVLKFLSRHRGNFAFHRRDVRPRCSSWLGRSGWNKFRPTGTQSPSLSKRSEGRRNGRMRQTRRTSLPRTTRTNEKIEDR